MRVNGYNIEPGADLRGADLREADLREADLRGAGLYGADLREADLREADLRGADLREADLREANLREANLYDANLRGTALRGADLNTAKNIYRIPVGDPRGYNCIAVKNTEFGWMIAAGCRWFPLDTAKRHWGVCYCRVRKIGDRYLAGLKRFEDDIATKEGVEL